MIFLANFCFHKQKSIKKKEISKEKYAFNDGSQIRFCLNRWKVLNILLHVYWNTNADIYFILFFTHFTCLQFGDGHVRLIFGPIVTITVLALYHLKPLSSLDTSSLAERRHHYHDKGRQMKKKWKLISLYVNVKNSFSKMKFQLYFLITLNRWEIVQVVKEKQN